MFIFIGFIFNLILTGYIEKFMKTNILKKFNKNNLYWFNKLLFSFLILCFIIVLSSEIIYLDTTINIKLNELDLNISGEYIDKIFTHFRAASAFLIGSRLAAAFLTIHPISLSSKIGITVETGAGSSAAFQMVNYGTGIIREKILAQQGLKDGTINLHIKDVLVNNGNNSVNLVSSQNLDPNVLIPKFQFNQLETLTKFYESYNNKLEMINKYNSNSKIIQLIEKQNNCSLNDIFSNNSIDEIIINSPLELNDLVSLNFKNDLITMLNFNLTVNLIMIYLIFMLTLIFIFKFVLDKNIFLEKINKLPLGNNLKNLLIKIISAWQKSSIF